MRCVRNFVFDHRNSKRGGSITPSGTTTISSECSQTFTITPATGYHISNVVVDGSSVGAVATYTFSSVSANHTIAATFASLTASSTFFPVNSGGGQYTGQSGVVYQADLDYTGGATASTTAAITGTTDPTLYQTERFGNFSYNIPLANGSYTVTLKFAEIYWTAAGQRIFNVSMQGTQVISKLDIYAQAGKNAAYDVTIPVSVTNGTLNITFTSVVDNAKVSAIVVTLANPTQPAIAFASASLSFSTTVGANPPNQTIALSNSGVGTLNWTATADSTSPAWLAVSPGSGTGSTTLTVSVNASGLAAGTYTKAITVAATGAANTPQTINVSLTVNPTAGSVVFAANGGGGQYTSQSSGYVYQADTYYSGGATSSTTAAITGTSDPALYQSERYGNFSYNIPLANGSYTVTLKFAEIYWTAAGERIFKVSMQGTQVISGLDIYAQVGKDAAYDLSFPVIVTNGTLNITFTSVVDNAKVSAILITPASTTQPIIGLSPTSLTFTTTAGTNPSNQTIALSDSGGGSLSWTATADSTSPAWLSVSPGSGTGNATLTVSANASGLAAGTYSKAITITATGAENTPQTVNVSLTVNPSSSAIEFATNSGGGQYTSQSSGIAYQADRIIQEVQQHQQQQR